MTESKIILNCNSVYKSFSEKESSSSKLEVLKGVDLTVEKGSFIAIVGSSGSGKSTLLHIMGGLDKPNSGSIVWDNQDIYNLTQEKLSSFRNEYIGFVFQFHHLLNEFSVVENVMLPMLIKKKKFKESHEKAMMLLKRFDIANLEKKKPSDISGGEQQRVAIARALANDPQVLLADEPTGNLDSVSSERFYDDLLLLNEQSGLTVILVTHNIELAGKCRYIYRMIDGKLLKEQSSLNNQ